jgi:hypothetical protein
LVYAARGDKWGAEALGYSKRRAEAKRKGPRAKRRGPWRRKRPRVRVEGQEGGPKGWPKQGRRPRIMREGPRG